MFDPEPEPLPPPVPTPPAITLSQRIGAVFEVVLCSGFPTQIVILTIMTGAGMRLTTDEGLWSPVFVSTLALADTALVVGLVWLFLATHGERAQDVLVGNRPVLPEAVLGIALLPIVFVTAVAILALLFTLAPSLHNVARNPLENMLTTRRDAIIFGIVAMIAGGVREEIQRGFILHRFSQYLGGGAAGVIIYSTLFGLGHVDQGWDATIAVAILGAIWGMIYLIRRSIVAPMVSHAGFNLAQLIKFAVFR